MRLLSEDMKSKSDILLITSPAKISEIVLGKFFAAVCVFLVMVLLTIPFTIICYAFGEPNSAEIFSGYIGFILLGLCFVSIGLFASSITENQIISAVIGFAISIAMMFMDALATSFPAFVGNIMSWLSILSRYSGFTSGYIELSAFIYYISFTAVFLFLTTMVIEKRRWSKS